MDGNCVRTEVWLWMIVALAGSLANHAYPQLERYTDPEEYCEAETFNPACRPSEVAVMTEAHYGRQKIGKCVKTDFGFVGCSASVMEHMDNQCSGKRTCSLRIPDTELDEAKPCPQEFKTYLNASYMCVKVDPVPCQMCHKTNRAKMTAPRAYIASIVTMETDINCGSANCPWLIEVEPGQKINITLMDFGLVPQTRKFYTPDICFRYAVIKEKAAARDTAVCGGTTRKSNVYTSVSNSVEIHIVSPEVFSKKGQFLLYYEAVGCPDRTPPKNTYMKREDDKIVVGCMSTGETWILKCNGTEWQGESGTCPKEHIGPPGSGDNVISLPLGVLIAIVFGIALVIGVLILTIGVVCLKRQHQDSHPYNTESAVYVRARQDPEYRDEMYLTAKSHPYHPQSQAAKYKACQRGSGGQVNLYSRKMDQRPLPSIPNIPAAAAAAAAAASASMGGQHPVPPIPQEPADEDPKMIIAEIHRTNSQASSNNYQSSTGAHEGLVSASAAATMVAGPRRPRAASARSQSGSYSGAGSAGKDDPQYFVLDPDELTAEDAAAGDRRAARAATQPPDAHGSSSSAASAQSKSPEEENEENQDKETHLNNSCHEIPLRPSRETPQSSRTEINNTGNTSWP